MTLAHYVPETCAPPSFEELYEANVRFVWRTLRRLGLGESDVADATQEVFLIAHRRLAEFEGRAKPTTWLFRIARNVARNQRRAAASRPMTLGGDEAIGALVDESADTAREVNRRQERAVLQAILDAMPAEQREAFVLFELEGVTAEEAAEALEVPIGTVYSRVRLARENFERSVSRQHARQRFAASTPRAGAR